jgi:hypothetical protein
VADPRSLRCVKLDAKAAGLSHCCIDNKKPQVCFRILYLRLSESGKGDDMAAISRRSGQVAFGWDAAWISRMGSPGVSGETWIWTLFIAAERSIDAQDKTGRSQGFFCGFALSDEYIGLLGFEACRFVFGVDLFYQRNEVLKPDGRDALLRGDGRTGFGKPGGAFGVEKTQRHKGCDLTLMLKARATRGHRRHVLNE